MNVLVTENIRQFMKEGNVVEMTGALDRYLDSEKCTVILQLKASYTKVIEQYSKLSTVEYDHYDIRQKKSSSGYKRVQDRLLSILEEGRKPKVAIIIPDSSKVMSDINAGLSNMSQAYDILIRTVRSFSDKEALLDELDYLDTTSPDCIAITRGGGVDFKSLENKEVLTAVAQLRTPFITALGHEEERPFIQDIADLSLATPTAFGTFLRDCANSVSKKKKVIYELNNQVEELNKRNKRYLQIIIGFAVALVVVLVIALFTAK